MQSAGNNRGSSVAAEDSLSRALEEQSMFFEQAMVIIDSIDKSGDLAHPNSLPLIQHLQQMLEKVTSAQEKVARTRKVQEQTGRPLSAVLKQRLSEEKIRLEKMLSRVNAVFSALEQARDSLVPRLDAETRRRSMQTAYQKSLKTI
jgi:hypothetical protein